MMHLTAQKINGPTALAEFRAFLESNKLPFADISLDNNLFLGYADSEDNLIGSAGLEIYGASGLIRSIAVHPAHRGQNLGKEIVDDILEHARKLNIHSLFLLTETAHNFFLKKGFKDISRDEVPDEIKASSEFSFVCPSSAKCMTYDLS